MKAPKCGLCLDDQFFPPMHKKYIYECLCECHDIEIKGTPNDKGIQSKNE